MKNPVSALEDVLRRAEAAAAGRSVRVLAVSKQQPPGAVATLARSGLRAFGENYVQEGLAKIAQLAGLGLEWHFVGPLQSNKCRDVARHFDWLQSLDREKLVEPLARSRPAERGPLDVLVQVNVDDEASKSGCPPTAVRVLADAVASRPSLRLRGLMAIPAPHEDRERRRAAFARMRALHERLRADHPGADTLSMGMSDDFELAIAEGATMVRIGTALFGSRS